MSDGQFSGGGVDFGTNQTTSSSAEGEAAVQSHRIDERAKILESTYDYRNRYLTDDDINDLLGEALSSEFQCVEPPSSYVPLVSSNGTSAKPNFIAIARAELEQELRAELQLRAGIFQHQPILPSSGGSGGVGAAGGGGGAFLIPESMGEGLPNVKPSDAILFEVLLKYHGIEDDADIPAYDLPLVLTMRSLLKIKNGDSNQRKAGIKFLTTKVEVLGVGVVMPAILRMWEGGFLDLQGKHYIVKLLLRLIYRLSTSSSTTTTIDANNNTEKKNNGGMGSDCQHPFVSYATELVGCVETLLSEPDPGIRDDGRDLISLLAQYLGLKTIFAAIRNDVTHEDDGVRRHTAKVIAIVGQALGPEHLAHILRPCAASESHLSRHTAVKAIYESCALLEHALLPVLPDLAGILSDLLTDSSNRVKGDAAHALAALADVVAPHGYAALRPLVGVVREFCRHSTGEGKLVTAFLRALGSLIPLMPAADAQRNTRDVMPALVHKFNTPDDEVRRVVLRVVYQCISATGYLGGGGAEATGFLDALFSGFWAQKRAAADPKTRRLLVGTTEEAAARYASSGAGGGGAVGGGGAQGGGASEVLSRLVPFLQDEFEATQAMAVEAGGRRRCCCGGGGWLPSPCNGGWGPMRGTPRALLIQ
jgi:splicing factor 3B subunit 1